MRTNAKEREKMERQVRRAKKTKGIEAQRAKHPTPSRTNDALIGDEEQNGKRENKKKETEQIQNPATLDHSFATHDAQGSYGE